MSVQEAKALTLAYAGVGLGLRWEFLDELLEQPPLALDFLEISPENYVRRGGYFPSALEQLVNSYQFLTHGLTMSVGASCLPPDDYFCAVLQEIKRVKSPIHSDHLCLGSAGSYLFHNLLPLPQNSNMAAHVARQIREIEERLERPFILENISFYAHLAQPELPETEFLTEILERANCGLLLDINNVYVNALNHHFDADEFIASLPLDRVVQIHVAGHRSLPKEHRAAPLIIDDHGSTVPPAVQALLVSTLEKTGPLPVLLERDNQVPPLAELVEEVQQLRALYQQGIDSFKMAAL